MIMATSARKQVLVQLNEDLLGELDELAAKTGRNRSDLAREALSELLRKYRAADVDRRYVDAYTRFPPDAEFDDDAKFDRNMAELDAWDGGW